MSDVRGSANRLEKASFPNECDHTSMRGEPSRQIRVLAYSDSIIFSGAEALFCDVLNGLAADHGFELTAAAPASNRALTERLADVTGASVSDVPPQPLKLAAFHLLDRRRQRLVSRVLARSDADVLLLNLPSAEYGAVPLLTEGLGDTPTVGLLHIAGRMGALGFRLGRIREAIARRAMKRLDRVCVVTSEAAEQFPRYWKKNTAAPARIRMRAPEMVPKDRDQARAELGLDPEAPLIGMVGRLTVKQKGHDTLVDASVEVLRSLPQARFLIAGEGRDRGLLEQRIRARGVHDSWHFLGQVSPIASLLSAIDLIAIPSRFEGLPIIALEALELGVPGVASSVDGLRDIWPEQWRVPPSDPEALAETLIRIIGNDAEINNKLIAEGRRLMAPHVTHSPSNDVARVLLEAAHG